MAQSKPVVQVQPVKVDNKPNVNSSSRVAEQHVQDGRLVVDDRDLNPGVKQ